MLLRKNDLFKVVFGFKCLGIPNVVSEAEAEEINDPLVTGLIDFPPGETMTLHQQVFVDGAERIDELEAVAANAPNDEVRFLIKSDRKNVEVLSDKKLRKHVNLDIYVTYSTIANENESGGDYMDKTVRQLESVWANFMGEKEQRENQRLEEVLNDAYYQGYERWYNFLSVKLGLEISTFNNEQIWQKVASRFSSEDIPPPQIIHVTPTGLEKTVNSELNPVSRIFLETPVPVAHEKYIHNKDKYVGVYCLEEKAIAWKDAKDQLRSIWKVLARDDTFDTEVFAQISCADKRKLRENMTKIAEQAIRDAEEAAESKHLNLGAKKRMEKAIEAGEALYEDTTPFKTAVVFLAHRDSPKELDRTHNLLKDQFNSPLVLTKENIYPYETWAQTFPICWQRLMSTYDRLGKYTNVELPGILPLVQPINKEKGGLELISTEGGQPIHLNFWEFPRHVLILATSRAGKGILLAKIIAQHLARNVPTSIIDYPNDDGTGTFTDFAGFLGDLASYFHPDREKINILEILNLSKFDRDEQNVRMDVFKEGVVEILETMVCGANPRPELDRDTIVSLLTIAVELFYGTENRKIYNRFVAANRDGHGSKAWQNMPTLHDFKEMLGPERLEITNPSAEQIKAFKYIKLRIDYWLNTKIGRAISSPSTFKADSLLTVYALTKLSNADDAAVMALAITQEAERKAMAHKISAMIVDEVSIQMENEPIAKAVGRKCAAGLKAGIQLVLAGQNVDSINKSKYKANILDNVKTRIIGLLEKSALDAIVDVFKIEREIIKNNATTRFQPIPHLLATNWLVEQNGTVNLVRYYADPIILAVTANNPKEVQRRSEILAQYSESDKFIALKQYADELTGKLADSQQ